MNKWMNEWINGKKDTDGWLFTTQSFVTSFGLNLLDDFACSSNPLIVSILTDLMTSLDASLGHGIEFLQW